jgi:hypothetical protein
MSWKDFEEFADSVFRKYGFQTLRNYRMKKPRAEIDLVAVQRGNCFVADCKHWKRTVGETGMKNVSSKQVARCVRLLEQERLDLRVKKVIPLVLTWKDEMLEILDNGVAIVPIHKLGDFLLNWESFGDNLLQLEESKGVAE